MARVLGLIWECPTYERWAFKRRQIFLRSLLLRSAKSAVGGFALTSANHELAIELVKKRYGKKVVIQRALISKLLNPCPVFDKSDQPRICSHFDFAEMKCRVLQALGVEEWSYSEVVMPRLLEKIPNPIRLTITQGKKYLEWTFGGIPSGSGTERGANPFRVNGKRNSDLFFNVMRKRKMKIKSVFPCHMWTKNGNGIWIPFSYAIEKRLALRYMHSKGCCFCV